MARSLLAEAVQLELLLLDPKLHVAWVDFALRHLQGTLRLTVHNTAASLHKRMRTAKALLGLSVETVVASACRPHPTPLIHGTRPRST